VPKSASIPAEEPSASRTFIPETYSLATLTYAAGACTACDLYQRGTQVVFGEGPKSARLMLIGEQPGDQEDREGKPFVGPAGRLLDRVLAQVGLDRGDIYVTNAVKHFKWEPRGKRRIHVKPSASEVQACRGWLLAELSGHPDDDRLPRSRRRSILPRPHHQRHDAITASSTPTRHGPRG
jgi:uracil-DNA glycosylase family protein